MKTVCFRCRTVLGAARAAADQRESHGICVPCTRRWFEESGLCPTRRPSVNNLLRCRGSCPIRDERARLDGAVPAVPAVRPPDAG